MNTYDFELIILKSLHKENLITAEELKKAEKLLNKKTITKIA